MALVALEINNKYLDERLENYAGRLAYLGEGVVTSHDEDGKYGWYPLNRDGYASVKGRTVLMASDEATFNEAQALLAHGHFKRI